MGPNGPYLVEIETFLRRPDTVVEFDDFASADTGPIADRAVDHQAKKIAIRDFQLGDIR